MSYAVINDMKLIAVSFNESDHYNLHELLFNKAKEEFTKEKVLNKGGIPLPPIFFRFKMIKGLKENSLSPFCYSM